MSILVTRGEEVKLKCNYNKNYTSDMQGMVWGEPELSHVWEFDHMVFFTVKVKECQH